MDVTITPIDPDFRLERVEGTNTLQIISNFDRNVQEIFMNVYIPVSLEIHDGYVIKWEIAPKFRSFMRHILPDMDSFGPPIVIGVYFGLSLILGTRITEQISANDVVITGTIMTHEEYDAPEVETNLDLELF